MIENDHPDLSVRSQSKLLDVNRNRLKPRKTKVTEQDELIMKDLDKIYTKWPFYGQRKLSHELQKHGWKIGRKRTRRLMQTMGIEALVPKPSLSQPNKDHKIYPYLVAIMDWKSRAVLSWELSNTMDSGFCVRALRRAMASTGRKPKIFNTDQGSQFTGQDWMSELKRNDILISMDGKGRWMDNVFIERLWRSLKYEKIRLYSYNDLRELRSHIRNWMEFYNHERIHQHLGYTTPWSNYEKPQPLNHKADKADKAA